MICNISDIDSRQCGKNMRESKIDNNRDLKLMGRAGNDPKTGKLIISDYERTGAAWLKRKVLIGKNFSVNFKIHIDNACLDSGNWSFDGFTILLSKSKNYINGTGGQLGYFKIFDAVVGEYDFHKNDHYNDVSKNSMSIHKCFKSECEPNEGINSSQVPLDINYSYQKCSNGGNDWDITMIYDGTDLKFYFGNDILINSMKMDLEKEFNSISNLAFTGFIRGWNPEWDKNAARLELKDIVVCEDILDKKIKVELAKTSDKNYIDKKIEIVPGETIYVKVTFYDSDLQNKIPHYIAEDSEIFKFNHRTSCGTISEFEVVDSFTMVGEIKKCESSGSFTLDITFKDNIIANTQKGYEVTSDSIKEIKITTAHTKREDKKTYFDGSENENWLLSKITESGKKFKFEYQILDSHDKIYTTPLNDCSDFGWEVKQSVFSVEPECAKNADSNGKYSIQFEVDSPGLFEIKSSFLNINYYLKVVSIKVDNSKSVCAISDYTEVPTIKPNDRSIKFSCALFDEYNNPISASTLSEDVQCVYKINGNVEIGNESDLTKTANGFECNIIPKTPGLYIITGQYEKTANSWEDIRSNLNSFKVKFFAEDLHNIAFKDNFAKEKKWIKLNDKNIDLKNLRFDATLAKNTNLIGYISFLDSNNKRITNRNNIEINLNDIVAKLFNPKIDNYSTLVYVNWTSDYLSSEDLISLTINNPETFWKRTTHDYKLDLKYKEKQLSISYKFDISGIDGCVSYPLEPTKTSYTIAGDQNNIQIRAAVDTLVATLVTRSKDDCIYNYWIELEEFKTDIQQFYIKKGKIEGFYEIRYSGTKAGTYNVSVSFKNFEFIKNLPFTVLPDPNMDIISSVDSNNFSDKTNNILIAVGVDKIPTIDNSAVDIYGNPLSYSPNESNNHLGVVISLMINSKYYPVNFNTDTMKIDYDSDIKNYRLWDYYKISGSYEVTLKGIKGNSIVYKYEKNSGKIDQATSEAYITSGKEGLFNTAATAALVLKDRYGNVILEKDRVSNIKVTAKHIIKSKTKQFSYSYSNKKNNQIVYQTDKIKNTGLFTLTVIDEEHDASISCYQDKQTCAFQVKYKIFDFLKSLTNIIISSTKLMSTSTVQQISNTSDNPIFDMTFRDYEKNVITFVEPNTKIDGVISGEGLTIKLNSVWVGTNKLQFTLPKDKLIEFKGAPSRYKYYLTFTYKQQSLKYELKFLGDGNDDDAGNGDPDFNNTVFDNTDLLTTAGKNINVNFELRTAENLRVNRYYILNDFKLGLVNTVYEEGKYLLRPQYGAKKGTYFITIMSQKTYDYENAMEVTITYKNQLINQKIFVEVKSAELSYFDLKTNVPEADKAKYEENELINGKVERSYRITLIPYDKYKNVCDQLTDMDNGSIARLFNFAHNKDGLVQSYVNSYYDKIDLSITSRTSGIVKLSSTFLLKDWTINFLPGSVWSRNSYGNIINKELSIFAGDSVKLKIWPQDRYKNLIPNDLLSERDLKKLDTYFKTTSKPNSLIDSKKLNKPDNTILYETILTESGLTNFYPKFGSANLKCSNCQMNVKVTNIDFTTSKVYLKNINDEVLIEKNKVHIVDSGQIPIFKLYLNDKYDNRMTEIPEEVEIEANLNGATSSINLCVTPTNNYYFGITVCPKNEKRKEWKFLTNSEYKLEITKKIRDKPIEKISRQIKLDGGSDDSDASNGPIDVNMTYISVKEIKTVAGYVFDFMIELRTKEGKRKKFVYEDPTSKIIPQELLDNNDTHYWNNIQIGAKPGQYIVQVKSKKAYSNKDGNKLYFVIEGTRMKKEKYIPYIITPDKPNSAKLLNQDPANHDNDFDKLIDGNADKKYNIYFILFDQYMNAADIDPEEINYSVKSPDSTIVQSEISKKPYENESEKNIFTISLDVFKVGIYKLSTQFIDSGKNQEFNVLPGAPNESNSLLVAPKNGTAGKEVKILITPYDKNGNYINPATITNPFELAYNFPNSDGKKSNYFDIKYTNDPNEEYSGKDSYVYKQVLTKKGQNFFRATLGSDLEIGTVNTITSVQPSDPYFPKYLFTRMDPGKGEVPMDQIFPEDNKKTNPIYQIYPRDKYENIIDNVDTLSFYTAIIKEDKEGGISCTMKNSGIREKITDKIIFTKDDENNTNKYSNLVKGKYILSFYRDDGTNKEKIDYTVNLLGSANDEDASNDKLDIQQTVINEKMLSIQAGGNAYIIIELRTITGFRRNEWGHTIKINPMTEDSTFGYTVKEAGKKGCYLIDITTKIANNFPTPARDFKFEIIINKEKVKNLQPQLDVSPNEMKACKVVKDYLDTTKDQKDNFLFMKDGSADDQRLFKISCKDKYDNICKAVVSPLKIAIENPKKNNLEFTTTLDVITGKISFRLNPTISGEYKMNGSAIHLANGYKFTTIPGELSAKNTMLNLKDREIIAGKTATLEILPKDQYFNTISPNLVFSKFKTTVSSPSTKTVSVSVSKNDLSIRMTAILTEKGVHTWTTLINSELRDNELTTNVKTGLPKFKNSDVYINNNNVPELTLNGESIKRKNSMLSGYIILKDEFKNPITSWPKNYKVTQPFIFSGNNMDAITLENSFPINRSRLIFNIPSDKLSIFNNLVAMTNYVLKFQLGDDDYASRTEKNLITEDFSYKIEILSDRDDNGHGNGDYVVSKTQISNSNLTINAGTTKTLELTLKTQENLIYNADINVGKIKYSINIEDNSFDWKEPKKKTTGVYIIEIGSSMLSNPPMEITVSIINPEDVKEKVPTPITLTVIPDKIPVKKYTQVKIKPNDKTASDGQVHFEIILFDKFKNMYVNNKELLKYLFLKLEGPVETTSTLKDDGKTYKFIYDKLKYPPRQAKFEFLYDDKVIKRIISNEYQTYITSSPMAEKTRYSGDLSKMKAGNTLDIKVYLFDSKDICVDTDENYPLSVEIQGPLNSQTMTKFVYSFKLKKLEVAEPTNGCVNYYQIITQGKSTYNQLGSYNIKLFAGEDKYVVADLTQTLIPDSKDLSKFVARWNNQDIDPAVIPAGKKLEFTIQAYDKYFNKVVENIKQNIKIKLIKDNKADLESANYTLDKEEIVKGTISGSVTVDKSGTFTFVYSYDDDNDDIDVKKFHIDKVNGPNEISVLPNICSSNHPKIDYEEADKVHVGEEATLTMTCQDIYKNIIHKGGEPFESIVSVIINTKTIKTSSDVKSSVTDNNDGTYSLKFLPQIAGKYKINLTLNKQKYGDTIEIDIKDSTCPEKKPNRCPNNLKKCAATPYDCIEPENDCLKDTDKPFSCNIGAVTKCVHSQKDCDCPEGMMKCKLTNVCVETSKVYQCPFFLPIDCKRYYPDTPSKNYDGICRINKKNQPNRRVCPVGYKMCPDLSCRKNFSECIIYPDCASDEIRCLDQTCRKDQKDCPTMITCSDSTEVVCPDGTCVANEALCKPLTICNEPNTILCMSNICVSNEKNCPKQISCGQGQALCSDIICRSNCNEHEQ